MLGRFHTASLILLGGSFKIKMLYGLPSCQFYGMLVFWNIDSTGVSEILDAQIQNSNMYAILLEEESGESRQFVRGIIKNGTDISFVGSNELPQTPFTYTAPIYFEDEQLGKVTIVLTDRVLRSFLIKNELIHFCLEMIVLLFLALPLSYLIANSFITPVTKLADSFSTVVDNNFKTPVTTVKEREIQKISEIFESVRLTLLDTFATMRKNEKDVTTTLNSLTDGIISIDAEQNITRMNPTAEKMTGWKSVEAISQKLSDVLSITEGDSFENEADLYDTLLSKSELDVSPIQVKLKGENDQAHRTLNILSSHLVDEKKKNNGIVLVLRDVTDEIKVQEELKQKRKMESLGQLSGGVAHDFNNMLAGIIGFAELLNNTSEPNSEEEEFSQYILDAAGSAADLTAKLLAFSRKGKIISTPFSIHKSCDTAVSILTRSINKNINIHTEFRATNEFITGDPSQIQNAILNLCINAKDAMPDGGKLFVSTDNVMLEKDNQYKLSSGTYLALKIEDTGTGIPDELKDKIFEPFFTTKEQGKGTGLGLAAVYGAILNHHGTVTVESTAGFGTTFTVVLPTVERAVESTEKIVPSDDKPFNKHILVVDDEKIIRTMLDRVITDMGGEVTQVADGVEAVALFREKHETIDLVILDMVMPNMMGDECFYLLKGIDSTIPIVLASGFDKNSSISGLLENGAVGYLHKPFNTNELTRLLLEYT